MGKKRFIDVAVVTFFIVLSLLLFLFIGKREEGAIVRVRVDGRDEGTYSLSVEGTYSLNGGSNILVIEGGKAMMYDADCPDKLCVRQGKIHRSGETITCLPNRLTCTVEEEKGEVDLVL